MEYDKVYVYKLSFPSSSKEYIGLTQNVKARVASHNLCSSNNLHKNRWISKHSKLSELQIEILHGPVTRAEAHELERQEIASRDRNSLINLTVGGEMGYPGKLSKENRLKLVEKFTIPIVMVDFIEHSVTAMKHPTVYLEENGFPVGHCISIVRRSRDDLDIKNTCRKRAFTYKKRYVFFQEVLWNSLSDSERRYYTSGEYFEDIHKVRRESEALKKSIPFVVVWNGEAYLAKGLQTFARKMGLNLGNSASSKLYINRWMGKVFNFLTPEIWDSLSHESKEELKCASRKRFLEQTTLNRETPKLPMEDWTIL